MKRCFIIFFALMLTGKCFSQTGTNQAALDSISMVVIHYFQAKQPDSIYALTNKDFQTQVSAATFKSISEQQLFPINDFKNVSFVKTTNNINKYKVEGTPVLQLLVGLDAENKIQTLLIQPFSAN